LGGIQVTNQRQHRVIIVGGGFGGLRAASRLRDGQLAITLIDRRNYHLFQPLLYQVATGGLSPANIAVPLRNLLYRQKNVQVLLGEVTGFDVERRVVQMGADEREYDTLILAAGSSHSYFGKDEWAALAPGLKSVDDATTIRRKILLAFEEAERARDPELIRDLLTFVIVGGGPTGVEMAGAVSDLAYGTLKHDYRTFQPSDTRIVLIEGHSRLLPPFSPDLSHAAERGLQRLGVEVVTGGRVTDVQSDHVLVHKDGEDKRINTRTVIWAAGVQASPLGHALAEATGTTLDRSGRVVVEPDLSLPGHPEIFIIGDMANFALPDGQTLPALAPVAMQQGEYVARLIQRRLKNQPQPAHFHYRDYGTMATVGRKMAVVDLHGWRFSGVLAWFVWLLVHLMQIVQFQNRLLVLIQWAWLYFTRNRSARLITGAIPAETPTAEPEHEWSLPR
jgi:NADH dehydrogenase